MKEVDVLDRRAQVTAFLVLGIIVIVIGGIIIYIRTTSLEQVTGPEAEEAITVPVPSKAEDISAYVEACILNYAPEGIKLMALQGGTFALGSSRPYSGINYRILCRQEQGYEYCSPILLTRQDMESELSGYLTSRIRQCVNLDHFKEQGFTVVAGNTDVDVDIASDDVIVTVNYPITISSDRKSTRLNSSHTDISRMPSSA